MDYPARAQKQSRMQAGREDPWISVSLLSEHTYCPRAGIIQNETGEADTGEERFHLGRGKRKLVFYDFRQLSRALKRAFITIVCLIVILLVVVLMANFVKGPWNAILAANTTQIYAYNILLIAGAILRWLYIYLFFYLPARLARATVPDPFHTESQQVKWWGLLNAGFHPIRPQDQYRDVQWHLAGCPWRVLVKGDLRIPVFRKRASRGTSGDRLFRQHYARMAAYCHLLEKCENARSPYGIVLLGDSHKGITVPYQPGSKKTFHTGLINARQTIAHSNGRFPPYPSNPQICVLCPHSRRDRATELSACGQRFRWTPPNYRDDYE